MVAAAFAAMFTVFGVAYSFGAFFEPVSAEFRTGRGATSAIFAVTGFLYFSLGAVSGRAADRFGARRVLLVGAVAMGFGLVLAARAPAFWVAWAAYGLGVGIATACGYVPMVAAVGARFGSRRSLAIGVAVTGIGLGTLIIPPLAALLIRSAGWRASYTVFGIVAAAVLVLAAIPAGNAPHGPLGGGRPVWPLLRHGAFIRLYAGGVLTSFALFVAFVHLAPFARRQGADPVAAAALISVIGAGSIVARIGLGALALRLGALRTFQATVVVLATSFLVWLLFPAYPGLVIFATLLGLGYGGWVALSPSVMAELFGADGLGGTVGLLYTAAGVGALAGPWLAGALIDWTAGYTAAIMSAVVLALAAAAISLSVRPTCRVDLAETRLEVSDGGG